MTLKPQIADTSTIINFLKIDRLDLMSKVARVIVTDHVRGEITNHYPQQLATLDKGFNQSLIEVMTVTEPSQIDLFVKQQSYRQLGLGECSAIAVAIDMKYLLAIDDKRAIKIAQTLAPDLFVCTTGNIFAQLMEEGILSHTEISAYVQELATKHRFRMNSPSLIDVPSLSSS